MLSQVFTLDRRLVFLLNSFTMLLLMVDLLKVVRVSYPNSKMAEMKSQADSLKRSKYLMLFPLCPLRFLCLRKHAICWREHTMLWTSLLRNSFMLKRDITMKFPFHKLESAGMLALYGITMEEESSFNAEEWPLDVGSNVALLAAQGGWERRKAKLKD